MLGHGHHRSISIPRASQTKPLSHRFPLPFPFRNQPSQSPPLVAGAISCRRRSSLLPNALYRQPPSLSTRCSGTRVAAGVTVFHPPESRRPSSPFSLFVRDEREKKQEEGGNRRRRDI
uniref:Uncharacterized protein n=1 Tax=Oryza barthii TaxID=65489 RepID=A0A0D3HLD7_9ORYZ